MGPVIRKGDRPLAFAGATWVLKAGATRGVGMDSEEGAGILTRTENRGGWIG